MPAAIHCCSLPLALEHFLGGGRVAHRTGELLGELRYRLVLLCERRSWLRLPRQSPSFEDLVIHPAQRDEHSAVSASLRTPHHTVSADGRRGSIWLFFVPRRHVLVRAAVPPRKHPYVASRRDDHPCRVGDVFALGREVLTVEPLEVRGQCYEHHRVSKSVAGTGLYPAAEVVGACSVPATG